MQVSHCVSPAKMKSIVIFALSLMALAATLSSSSFAQSAATQTITVPKGRLVLLDGRLGSEEWRDARKIAVSPAVSLYLKQDDQYLYVAVEPSAPMLFGVNLYFDTGDPHRYLNLHASAKLGERYGHFGEWPEWVWWNNEGWAGNVERFNAFEGQRFLPDAAKELQISRSRLGKSRLLMRLDIETSSSAQDMPEKGIERDGKHWIELKL
jgi:hypothetical protein